MTTYQLTLFMQWPQEQKPLFGAFHSEVRVIP